MAEEPPHRDVLLAFGSEFRPVFDDRRVEVQATFLGQHVGGDGDHAFGAGPDHLQRLRRVRLCPARGGDAPREVDHPPAVQVDAACGSNLAKPLEVGGEGVLDGLETGLHRAVDAGLDHVLNVLLADRLSAPVTPHLPAGRSPHRDTLTGTVDGDLDRQHAHVHQRRPKAAGEEPDQRAQ